MSYRKIIDHSKELRYYFKINKNKYTINLKYKIKKDD